VHLIEDRILHSFLHVKLQNSAIFIFYLYLASAVTSNVFAQCKIQPLPKGTILFSSYDGQYLPFSFFICPVLCRRQALIEVLFAMPFHMLLEVFAFLFADYKP
jgi:hypothetical protein